MLDLSEKKVGFAGAADKMQPFCCFQHTKQEGAADHMPDKGLDRRYHLSSYGFIETNRTSETMPLLC